jgi:hypothetical protein
MERKKEQQRIVQKERFTQIPGETEGPKPSPQPVHGSSKIYLLSKLKPHSVIPLAARSTPMGYSDFSKLYLYKADVSAFTKKPPVGKKPDYWLGLCR